MIRDYLGAVSTAATRKLPKGDRLLFVGRTRAALEAQVGPLASADDADRVAAALTALGDPDELAAKERERLYSARRRGAAAEPPTLWKPPGKAGRRAAPPAKPPRSGPAEPRSAGGPAEARPRRSRTWPYRRTEPDDPALPGVPPSPAGSGTAEPGRPGPVNPEPEKPEPGTGGPGSEVHIPPGRQPEEPPGPAIRPAPPGWDAHRDGTQPGTATGPASAGRDTGRDGAPPGRKPGTVGPGTPSRPGWLGPAGTPGPGTPTGTAGPGAANGNAGPGVSGRSVGPGTSGGSAGPGASGRTVGPGASGPSVGPGGNHGAVGPAVQNGHNGHNGTAGPGAQNGAAPGGLNGAAAPGSQASRTAPGPSATAGPNAGPATQPGAAPQDGTEQLSIVPGMETSGPADDEPAGRRFGPPVPLAEAWLLARKNPLEAVAVVVLGIGGLLLPFPLWLVGALIAIFSRRWGKRDKWLALIGPPGFAVVCMLLLGISGGGNFFHALAAASHQFSLLLRVGSLLSAGYLVWRLRRGPQRRKTPPWLRGR
jgi:hypothetical protein